MTEADTDPDDGARRSMSSQSTSSVLEREAAQRASASAAALGRYRQQMRRGRAIYYPIVGAVVLGLVIAFSVAYLHGEAHNTRLVTVAKAPATLAVRTPAGAQHQLWRTTDRAAIGDPRYAGTVVVWGKRTVRGLNARTGKQTWSYYRSDRTVCSAAQIDGIAVAVYELAGNCDEITALDAGTGAREWTRTLDFNGLPVYGKPAFQADVADASLMITTSAEIYSIAIGPPPFGGEDRFEYSHFGCHINGATLGDTGALISQTCAKPRCGTLKFCGKGPQLLLRGEPTEDVDSSSTTNPNMIQWNNFGDTDVPVSGQDVVAAGNRTTGDLDLLASTSGKPLGSLDLGVRGSAWSSSSASSLDLGEGGLLVYAGDRLAFVRTGDSKPVWTAASVGAPTINGNTVVVPAAGGVRLLAQASGAVRDTYALTPAAPAGSTLYRLGSGFLAASTSGTTAYS